MSWFPIAQQQQRLDAATSATIVNEPTVSYSSNHSIDRVVFQVERLGGQFNDLSITAQKYGKDMVEQGQRSLNKFDNAFSNGSASISNLIEVVEERAGQIPLPSLYTVLIIAAIVIVLLVVYLMTTGGLFITEKYQRRRGKRQIEQNEVLTVRIFK